MINRNIHKLKNDRHEQQRDFFGAMSGVDAVSSESSTDGNGDEEWRVRCQMSVINNVKACSTLKLSFALVSMNRIPRARAKASPSELGTS